MKARTERLLYTLLWTAEKLARPTFRNVDESFEGWAYRSGLLRRVAELERELFLERRSKSDRLYRLTSKGRLQALGGRDPEDEWARPWDGWWRLICFDVPIAQNRRRDQLRYTLRSRSFGQLQRSVWISPDPLDQITEMLRKANVEPRSLILLQAKACGGESNEEIVCAAWDFERINQLYAHYLKFTRASPPQQLTSTARMNALVSWADEESALWNEAVSNDPLLPKELLPARYLGKKAWSRRMAVLKRAGNAIKSFRPS